MKTPKAIAYKSPDTTTVEKDVFTGRSTDIEEILMFKSKHNGYLMGSNLENTLAFLGDEEDYLNCALDNYEALRTKYNLDKKYISFVNSDVYFNTIFEGTTIYGQTKKSDKLNLMPYGIYNFTTFEGFYPGFVALKVNTDEYVKFENSEVMKLQETVINFFKKRDIYAKNKSRHKGASLMYGPPGAGKSTAIMNLINSPEFAGVYTIFIPKHMSFKHLDDFKQAFDGHDTLIVMEEMTERLSSGTEDILNFLDGYSSWNNCYVIATTNYPEVLPANLVDRPGRFNNLVEIKAPTEAQKIFYLQQKGFQEDDINKVIPKCKDFSLDYISQLALQSKLLELPLDQSLTILENNKRKVKGAFKGKPTIGMTPRSRDDD